nr:hypothetical protein [Tanacetum cinerariifolium]
MVYKRKPTRNDTQVPQPSGPTESVADDDVHTELGDRLVRAATTTSSLEAYQDSGLTARLESSGNKESLGEDASKQGRIDADEEITLDNVHDEVNVVEKVVEVINTA